MKFRVYSIFDDKVGSFSTPFFSMRDELAKRNFSALADDKEPNNMVRRFPADFSLYFLAEFDTDSGQFVSNDKPVFLCRAIDFNPSLFPAPAQPDGEPRIFNPGERAGTGFSRPDLRSDSHG